MGKGQKINLKNIIQNMNKNNSTKYNNRFIESIFIVIIIILSIIFGSLIYSYNKLKKEINLIKLSQTSQVITEEQAIEKVENYRRNTLNDVENDYKFRKIKKENINVLKYYYDESNGQYIDVAQMILSAYGVYYSFDDGTEEFTVYIDSKTGEDIGFYGAGV